MLLLISYDAPPGVLESALEHVDVIDEAGDLVFVPMAFVSVREVDPTPEELHGPNDPGWSLFDGDRILMWEFPSSGWYRIRMEAYESGLHEVRPAGVEAEDHWYRDVLIGESRPALVSVGVCDLEEYTRLGIGFSEFMLLQAYEHELFLFFDENGDPIDCWNRRDDRPALPPGGSYADSELPHWVRSLVLHCERGIGVPAFMEITDALVSVLEAPLVIPSQVGERIDLAGIYEEGETHRTDCEVRRLPAGRWDADGRIMEEPESEATDSSTAQLQQAPSAGCSSTVGPDAERGTWPAVLLMLALVLLGYRRV